MMSSTAHPPGSRSLAPIFARKRPRQALLAHPNNSQNRIEGVHSGDDSRPNLYVGNRAGLDKSYQANFRPYDKAVNSTGFMTNKNDASFAYQQTEPLHYQGGWMQPGLDETAYNSHVDLGHPPPSGFNQLPKHGANILGHPNAQNMRLSAVMSNFNPHSVPVNPATSYNTHAKTHPPAYNPQGSQMKTSTYNNQQAGPAKPATPYNPQSRIKPVSYIQNPAQNTPHMHQGPSMSYNPASFAQGASSTNILAQTPQNPYIPLQSPGTKPGAYTPARVGLPPTLQPQCGQQPYGTAFTPQMTNTPMLGAAADTSFGKSPVSTTNPSQGTSTAATSNTFKLKKTGPDMSLRIVASTVQGVKHWNKYRDKFNIMFVIIGQVNSAVTCTKDGFGKEFVLKDDKDSVKCLTYEIDRPSIRIVRGQQYRCVGRLHPVTEVFKLESLRPCDNVERDVHSAFVKASDKAMRLSVIQLKKS